MKFSKLLLLTLLLLIACSGSVTNSGEAELPRELTNTEKAIIQADRSFSIEMFKEIALSAEQENVLISPLSISMALGMTMNGANGQTYEEMQNTLRLNELTLPEINEGYSSLTDLLTSVDPKVEMKIANSVWSRQGFEVEEKFSENLSTYFDAEATELDFNNEKSVDVINNWVEEKTNGKIDKIINSISPESVMFLINTIYFKGSWVYAFDPESTQERSFELESGESSQVEMMNQKVVTNHYISQKVEMVDLPYGKGLFTMSLIKPSDRNISINTFIESELEVDSLQRWYNNSVEDSISIFVPKLELDYEKTLNTPLSNMGMPTAFGNTADFSGINPSVPLSITKVKHKTYLKLDEEGTEAAAVTSVEIGITSVGPKNTLISFDRSYLMVLREKESGAILFIGKVVNPNN